MKRRSARHSHSTATRGHAGLPPRSIRRGSPSISAAATNVNQVILRWEDAYGKAYRIQVSQDSATWTDVFSQAAGVGGVENLSFAPVSARYVRMYGTARGTQYGYSLYEFEVYGPAAGHGEHHNSAHQPKRHRRRQNATFSVTAGGTGPFSYQWLRNGAAIAGATASTYTTPTLSLADNGAQFAVTVGNAAGTATVTSTAATLSVGAYTVYPGFLGVDLVNNTNGAWANSQVYVTVIGLDPANGRFAYVTPAGAIVDFTMATPPARPTLPRPTAKATATTPSPWRKAPC